MSSFTYGSLCSGYGGLDMAVRAVFGGEAAWFSDIAPAAVKVHARHWPELENLGDVKAVDWSTVRPVQLVTAGYPCQPFSLAGQRKGEQDERHLWPHIAKGIRVLRPDVVVLENVAGHRSRGFGPVLADLAALGYRVAWGSVRASDVGAPHKRERVWIVASHTRHGRLPEWARHPRRPLGQRETVGSHPVRGGEVPGRARLLPTPTANMHTGPGNSGRDGGLNLQTAVVRLLPTPAARDWRSGRSNLLGNNARPLNEVAVMSSPEEWLEFEPAVRHWERVFGYPAPSPTVAGLRAARVLNAQLPEWMMGLPDGHVTATEGLTRTDMLTLLGNGVCPQQGEAALRELLDVLAQTD